MCHSKVQSFFCVLPSRARVYVRVCEQGSHWRMTKMMKRSVHFYVCVSTRGSVHPVLPHSLFALQLCHSVMYVGSAGCGG